ncbi:Sec8 exocyst complex component-specific domain-containing protein [Coniochaeta sp. 2T2.1]|nr:Sec8 exocyst complex component-specific domain-containing protein [Coniochaeta sp. 2T2.1]
MSNRYAQSFRNGNGYGNFGPPSGGAPAADRGGQAGAGGDDEYDPFGEGYASDRYAAPSSQPQQQRDRRPPPMASSRSQMSLRQRPSQQQMQPIPQQQQMVPPPRGARSESNAERQVGQVVDLVRREWPNLSETDSGPVQLGLQLLDTSSVGRAHEYRDFQKTHNYLQSSLKGIVHDYHQGFNSSIGTFHKIQGSIHASQKKVRHLKESLVGAKVALCATDPELKKFHTDSEEMEKHIQSLTELEDLRGVPDQLEARISEKRFLTAVEVLQNALRKLRKPELDKLKGMEELRNYLTNQEHVLMEILVEELHEHLYLKSPYCQERWQSLAKSQGAFTEGYGESAAITPFYMVLDSLDWEKSAAEDPAKNPEADTFSYVALLVEALNKLGRLEAAVDILKQRLPVELFGVVNETVNDIDQKHPSSLRGGTSTANGLHMYGGRETQLRADVIYDLLWTLYGKFEAIAEGHRVFHEAIKALIRREGAGNNSALLGSFKELWNLYQNEIRTLLHSYVTTDADVYQFSSAPREGAMVNGSKADISREHLFKFSETDAKSVEMVTELEALDGIIRAAVPGLTSASRKGAADKKAAAINPRSETRKGAGAAYGKSQQDGGAQKSLVEPSVFNMSLLLPPTLVFLQRLKSIVPPGSDLATSTLTSFLDNFLVNVFQPQLDETLGKLSDTVFGEADAFQQDPDWNLVSKRPVFKGTTSFFTVVTAFCRMLGTIPHDQALSSLIITQMMRYYDRCFSWYRNLVAKANEDGVVDPQSSSSLRLSAAMATEPSQLQEAMLKLWQQSSSDGVGPDLDLVDAEIDLLIAQATDKNISKNDIIRDRDTISSLCLLYTSLRWLSVKIAGLRHITKNEADSSRSSVPKPEKRRWTLLNDPNKTILEQGPVFLPMTQETVQSFDTIQSSYLQLATTSLLTLHAELRCLILSSLTQTLSPSTAPYLLTQEVTNPDPLILSLNSDISLFDSTTSSYLPLPRELSFLRTGLGALISHFLVSRAAVTCPINLKGSGRMQLNILVLQQNLKNVEPGVDLAWAANYFALFDKGAEGVLEKAREDAREDAERSTEGGGEGGGKKEGEGERKLRRERQRYTYDELKTLIEMCYSEQLADPERGVNASAKRAMGDKLLGLSEVMWQS